jgi:hypothetical protein
MKKRQIKKAMRKAAYWVLAGAGATQWMMTKQHSCAKLTGQEKARPVIKKFTEEFSKHRDETFRQACIEVLGEDPETDWQ